MVRGRDKGRSDWAGNDNTFYKPIAMLKYH